MQSHTAKDMRKQRFHRNKQGIFALIICVVAVVLLFCIFLLVQDDSIWNGTYRYSGYEYSTVDPESYIYSSVTLTIKDEQDCKKVTVKEAQRNGNKEGMDVVVALKVNGSALLEKELFCRDKVVFPVHLSSGSGQVYVELSRQKNGEFLYRCAENEVGLRQQEYVTLIPEM